MLKISTPNLFWLYWLWKHWIFPCSRKLLGPGFKQGGWSLYLRLLWKGQNTNPRGIEETNWPDLQLHDARRVVRENGEVGVSSSFSSLGGRIDHCSTTLGRLNRIAWIPSKPTLYSAESEHIMTQSLHHGSKSIVLVGLKLEPEKYPYMAIFLTACFDGTIKWKYVAMPMQ